MNGLSMEYFLFTYPNCQKCEALKKALLETDIEGTEYNLAQKDGKLKIREFLSTIKRDEKGGIIVPTLVLQDEREVVAVLNNEEELGDWLRSKV